MQVKSYLSAMAMISSVTTSLVLLTLFMTNPIQIGPIGVTVWFVLVLTSLTGIASLLLYVIKTRRQTNGGQYKRFAYSLRQGVLTGGGLTVFLALSSLRQLDLRDVILIMILLGLIEFYFRARA